MRRNIYVLQKLNHATMNIGKYLSMLLLSIFLIACNDIVEPGPAVTLPIAEASNARTVNALPFDASMTSGEQIARLDAATALLGDFYDITRGLDPGSSAQERDAALRPLLDVAPPEDAWMLEQEIAQYVLEAALLGRGQELDATLIAFHLEKLHENGSQRADLLYLGLQPLRGMWPDDKVQAYAEAGVKAAQKWQQQVATGPQLSPDVLGKAGGRNVAFETIAQYEPLLARLAR